MKRVIHAIFMIAVVLITSCKSNEKHDVAYDGFIYPYDSLLKPKVFIYKRVDTINTYSYRFKQVIEENGRKYILATSLNETSLKDSSKSILTGETQEPIELYAFVKGKDGSNTMMIQGEVRKFKTSDKYRVVRTLYKNPISESSTHITYTSTFNSFVNMKFQNKSLNCLVFDDNYKFKIKKRNIPLFSTTVKTHYKSVMAKGIGMIQYSSDDPKSDRSFVWELDTIMDYQSFRESQK